MTIKLQAAYIWIGFEAQNRTITGNAASPVSSDVVPLCVVCLLAHRTSPCPFCGIPSSVASVLAQTVTGLPTASHWRLRALVIRQNYDKTHPDLAPPG